MNLAAQAHSDLLDNAMIHQECGFGSDVGIGAADDNDGGRPAISVIYTNIEGTLAALDAAVRLSRGLEAQIVLIVAEEIAPCYSLDHPPAATAFFHNVCKAILAELQLDENAIRLEIHFCRRQIKCFETVLRPRSIVMLGTGHHFWRRREKKLAHTLNALGHDALLVQGIAFAPLRELVVLRLTQENAESELGLASHRATRGPA
jgi:hypothetical protein